MASIGSVRGLIVIGCGAVGAEIGTLTPRLVYRLAVPGDHPPRRECLHCQARLPVGWRGWLAVDNRCRACRRPLGRHAWVYVAATGVGFAALGWRLPLRDASDVVLLSAWCLLTAVGVVLAGIDLSCKRLPAPIIGGIAAAIGLLVGVAAFVDRDLAVAIRAGVASAALGGMYLVLALIGGGRLGMGDVRLAALLGVPLGASGVSTAVAGAVLPHLLALPVLVVLLAMRRVDRRTEIPFGPYLIAGALLAPLLVR